jgi:hypothetical protein
MTGAARMTITVVGHVESLERGAGEDTWAKISMSHLVTRPPYDLIVKVPPELVTKYLPGTTVNITIYYTGPQEPRE